MATSEPVAAPPDAALWPRCFHCRERYVGPAPCSSAEADECTMIRFGGGAVTMFPFQFRVIEAQPYECPDRAGQWSVGLRFAMVDAGTGRERGYGALVTEIFPPAGSVAEAEAIAEAIRRMVAHEIAETMRHADGSHIIAPHPCSTHGLLAQEWDHVGASLRPTKTCPTCAPPEAAEETSNGDE